MSSGARPATRARNSARRRDGLAAADERDPSERGRGVVGDEPRRAGQPRHLVVVEHDRLAVGGLLHVELDAVAGGDRGLGGGAAVLHDPGGPIVQPAMGDRRGEERARQLRRSRRHLRPRPPPRAAALATPIAERAWRPRSPKTSTIRSEAPLMTFGWSVKSGAELTKPVSFTTRRSRSRSPSQATRSWAMRASAQVRAAAAPAATSSPGPELAEDQPARVAADLAGDVDGIARRDERDVGRRRGGRVGQGDAELGEAGVELAAHAVSFLLGRH